MTPYSNTFYGDSTYQDTYSSLLQRFPAVYESLSNVSSIDHGDHKTPYPQSFVKSGSFEMSGSIFQQYHSIDFYSSRRGILPGFPNPTNLGLFDSNVYNSCASNLYEKIRGSADLAVDIAELNQTKAMMNKTIRGLGSFTKTLRSMRHMRFSEARDAYLEWTYGWKPLASSIFETGKQLKNQLLTPKRSKLTIEAKANSYSRSTSTIDLYPGVKIVTIMETSNRVRMVTNWKLGNDMNEAIASFTSLNPASIAWELMPYSFVVDWAVDIGGYLRNLESAALYNSSFLNGYVTYTAQGTSRSELSGSTTDGVSSTSYQGRCSNYTRRKVRSPMTEAPFPVLPTFDLNLSFDRLTSAVALATQAVSKLHG